MCLCRKCLFFGNLSTDQNISLDLKFCCDLETNEATRIHYRWVWSRTSTYHWGRGQSRAIRRPTASLIQINYATSWNTFLEFAVVDLLRPKLTLLIEQRQGANFLIPKFRMRNSENPIPTLTCCCLSKCLLKTFHQRKCKKRWIASFLLSSLLLILP